jgi:hypothetical protein
MERSMRAKLLIVLSLVLIPELTSARVVDGLQAPGPKQQIGPQTRDTSAVINSAAASAPGYIASLMSQAGQLAVNMESGGNEGIWNGTCCTGLLQMTVGNLTKYGHYTPHTYANAGLQAQVNSWVSLTSAAANTPAVRTLTSAGKFDGQTVDSAFLLACIQLGPGNCQKMVSSGKCNGFADINGTSICKMAARIRGGSGAGHAVASAPQGTGITGGNGESGNSAQADPTPTMCTSDMINTEIGANLPGLTINAPATNTSTGTGQ